MTRTCIAENVPKTLTGADLSAPTKKSRVERRRGGEGEEDGKAPGLPWRGLAPITNRAPVVRFLSNIKYFSRDNGMRRNRHGYSRVQFAVAHRGAKRGTSGEAEGREGEGGGGARRVTRFECI